MRVGQIKLLKGLIFGVSFWLLLPFAALAADSEPVTLRQARDLIQSFAPQIFPPNEEMTRSHLESIRIGLDSYRRAELARYLSHLGEPTGVEEARGKAAGISRRNFHREMGSSRLLEDEAAHLSRRAVSAWLATYRHNTNNDPGDLKTQALWLSSKQLESLHLPAGLQSHEINRKFLRTQNWVFFFVGRPHEDRYGPISIYLKKEAARKDALVFPYVMYLTDLIEFAEVARPDLYARLTEYLRKRQPYYWNEYKGYSEPLTWILNALLGRREGHMLENLARYPEFQKILEEMRSALLDFTFTEPDFEQLVTVKFAEYLRELERTDAQAHRDLRERIQIGEIFNDRFRRHMKTMYARLGWPAQFELRIPVALPASHLQRSMMGCEARLK